MHISPGCMQASQHIAYKRKQPKQDKEESYTKQLDDMDDSSNEKVYYRKVNKDYGSVSTHVFQLGLEDGDGMVVLLTRFMYGDGKDHNYVVDFLDHLKANTGSILGFSFDIITEYVECDKLGVSTDRQLKKLTNRSKHNSFMICSDGINPDDLESISSFADRWTAKITECYLGHIKSSLVEVFRSDWEITAMSTKPIFHQGCLNLMMSDTDAALLMIRHYSLFNIDEHSIKDALGGDSGTAIVTFALGKAGEAEKEFMMQAIKGEKSVSGRHRR